MEKYRENIQDFWETRVFSEFYFFAIALILAFGTLQTTGTLLETGKPVVTVISCSMYPVYDVGDIVFIQGAESSELERGDIIVYDSSQSNQEVPIVHRVTEVHDGYVETKGDNNPDQLSFEREVKDSQIHGKAFFRIPRIGGIKLLAMDLTGYNGGEPLVIDSYPNCTVDVPLDEREY